MALVSAYKRNFHAAPAVRVNIDRETGEIKVFAQLKVVEEVENRQQEVELFEARVYDARCQIGDTVEMDVTPKEFEGSPRRRQNRLSFSGSGKRNGSLFMRLFPTGLKILLPVWCNASSNAMSLLIWARWKRCCPRKSKFLMNATARGRG